jgi:hypothetical protein
MPAATGSSQVPSRDDFLLLFGEVSDAVESGAGLPEVARATGRALGASVAVLDAAGSVLASACASPADERAVLSGEAGSERVELRVADAVVGHLLFRARAEAPQLTLRRMVATLIALEVERLRGPERASEAAVGSFLADVFDRRLVETPDIVARGLELGVDLSGGASVLLARAHPQQPEEGDWRARVLAVAERGARGVARSSLAASLELGFGRRPLIGHSGSTPGDGGRGRAAELVVLVPGSDGETAHRAAAAVLRELETGLHHFTSRVTRSRPAADAAELHRAGAEALLAANVAEAHPASLLAFEETGAYRVLLPWMREDPAELHRFHEETVAPLLTYDEQYETSLVQTLEAFLEADGNVAKTAQKLFTHRHTIRYRLERVRELSGFDVASSDGRESLSLGLKAMRVLGVTPPGGPATEPGTAAGRVRPEGKDR